MEMFRRFFFAAVLAGIVAGLFSSALQQWRLVPLILQAEEYEITSPVVEVNFYENYESYRKDFDYKLLKYFNYPELVNIVDKLWKGEIGY